MKIALQEQFIDNQLNNINNVIALNSLFTHTKDTIKKLHIDKVNGTRVKDNLNKWSRLLKRIELYIPLFIQQAIEEQNIPIKPGKDRYRYLCSFNIKPSDLKQIKGYSLLCKYGFYNRETNPSGVVKDHRFSVNAGYKLNLDPKLLSKLNNCEFLLNRDNIRKSDSCSITLEELLKV